MVRVEAGRKSVESNFHEKLVECNEALHPFFKTDQFDVKAKERNDLTGQKKVNNVMLFLYIDAEHLNNIHCPTICLYIIIFCLHFFPLDLPLPHQFFNLMLDKYFPIQK